MTAMRQPDPDLAPLLEGGHPAVRGVTLLFRFLLELAMLAALGWCAYLASGGRWWSGLVAFAAVVMVGAAWAAWLSPRAPYRPRAALRVLIEAVLFGGAGSGLWLAGHPWWGVALAGGWAVNRVVLAMVRPVR